MAGRLERALLRAAGMTLTRKDREWMTGDAVTASTREIGIRVALGARPRDVLGMVLGSGARLAAAGLMLGLAGAFASSRVLSSMLYGVTPHDPATFGIIALLMTAVAIAAGYVPARRAMRLDPVVALKND